MSIEDEARAEAEKRWPEGTRDDYESERHFGFTLGAEWQASRKVEGAPAKPCSVCGMAPEADTASSWYQWHDDNCSGEVNEPEAAPSDTDDEYQPTELAAALDRGSRWLHDNVHKSRGCIGCDICTIRSMMEVAAETLSRSQPVQVEVTDDMVERLARALFARSKEGRDGFTWPLNGDRDRQRGMNDARKLLVRVLGTAALGGGTND